MILKIEKYKDHNNKHRKRCLIKCDKCDVEGWRNDYYAVAKKEEHLCHACSNKRHGAMRIGKPSPFKGKKRKADHEYVVGSTYINKSGYIEEYVGRHTYEHRRGGYYLQHRKVVEESLGRLLTNEEKVHHIDGDKQNNTIDNLYVCSSMSHHKSIHQRLERLAFDFIRAGIIFFDKEDSTYKCVPEYSNILSKSGEFRETLSSSEYDNPEPSSNGEGATTISQESRTQESSKRPTSQEDDDIV